MPEREHKIADTLRERMNAGLIKTAETIKQVRCRAPARRTATLDARKKHTAQFLHTQEYTAGGAGTHSRPSPKTNRLEAILRYHKFTHEQGNPW